MSSQVFALPVPGSAWCLNLAFGHKEVYFFTWTKSWAPWISQSSKVQSTGPSSIFRERHSDSGEGAKKSAHHSTRSERLEQAKGTHCKELSMIWCSVGSTIKMIHWHLSVHQLFPAWLVSSQALSAGIAVPGRETRRSLSARLVLLAL